MKNIIYTTVMTSLLLLAGCQKSDQEQLETTSEPEIQENKQVRVGYLKVQPLLEEIYSTGVIDVPPMQRKVLHSYIEANITDVMVIQGEEVRKGQILATLRHPNLISLQQELLSAQTEMDFQQGELDRKSQLLSSNATSIGEINDIKRKLKLAQVTFEAKKEHLALLGIKDSDVMTKGLVKEINIRAPFDGKLSKVMVTNGQFVSDNDPIFEVISQHHKHLELDVFSKNASQVKIGQTIHFNIPGSDRIYTGKVYLINPDIENNKLRVHGHLDDENNDIKIGTFIEAKITIGNESVAQIELEELIQEGENYFLFRPTQDGYEKVAVSKGRSNEFYAEIKNIDTQQQWVVAGNYYLQ